MSNPSYQQLVQEQIPLPKGGGVPEGPMNHAVYDDSQVPEGGGTSLRDINDESVRPASPAEAHYQYSEVPRPRTPPKPALPPSLPPVANILPVTLDLAGNDSYRVAFLVFVLYLLVSSSFVSHKMAVLVPELFENPSGVVSLVGRGLLLAGLFYMIRTYMAT